MEVGKNFAPYHDLLQNILKVVFIPTKMNHVLLAQMKHFNFNILGDRTFLIKLKHAVRLS